MHHKLLTFHCKIIEYDVLSAIVQTVRSMLGIRYRGGARMALRPWTIAIKMQHSLVFDVRL